MKTLRETFLGGQPGNIVFEKEYFGSSKVKNELLQYQVTYVFPLSLFEKEIDGITIYA